MGCIVLLFLIFLALGLGLAGAAQWALLIGVIAVLFVVFIEIMGDRNCRSGCLIAAAIVLVGILIVGSFLL